MKQKEVENTRVAFDNFSSLTCDNKTIKADTSRPQVTNDTVSSNEIIGYMTFPKLGTSTAILQGDISDDQTAAMDRGVSHDPRSTMPGEVGNSVFAGHRHLFFKSFLDLEPGDAVIVNVGDNIYIYEIQSMDVINPEEVDAVFYDNDQDLLVMYTCFPIETWKPYTQRLVVKAKPISETSVSECAGLGGQ
ncbi:class D sortase [Mollicutes bacterium LVI A0039]|nr:class D sortase [Mollicutes bacterium LVI A0039]